MHSCLSKDVANMGRRSQKTVVPTESFDMRYVDKYILLEELRIIYGPGQFKVQVSRF